MDDLARIPAADRADAFTASARARGINAALLEKDFWVCWTLRRLYALDELSTGILFKGGTSLSKVFKAIERFSEDIDLSIDRAALGLAKKNDPAAAPSRKQRDKRLEHLSQVCRTFVHDTLQPQLRASFAAALGSSPGWLLEAATDDPDGQTLVFAYPSTIANSSPYVRPMVRMEFGARSEQWPSAEAEIVPYVAEDFPALCKSPRTRVRALAGERTFWEKATALHAWHCQQARAAVDRRSRHYYDLVRLYEQEIGKRAVKDTVLLEQVARHKAVFFPSAAAHYELARPGTLRLSPPSEQIDALRRDYQSMAEMFFGDRPSFDDLLRVLADIERAVNGK